MTHADPTAVRAGAMDHGKRTRVWVDKQSPEAYRALVAFAKQVRATARQAGLDRVLVELVNIRVSQINGCAFCLDLHVRDALKNGETAQRLAVLPAWRDADLFTDRERAALVLAESITRLHGREQEERDVAYAMAHLSPEEFSAVTWVTISMNAFNRISIVSKHPVRETLR